MRPQKVVVEAPFVYGSRHKPNLRGSGGPNLLLGSNKSFGHRSRSSLKSQLSLNTTDSSSWEPRSNKKQRQHSHTFGARTNVMTTICPPRKPGRPKREVSDNQQSHTLSSLCSSRRIISYPIHNPRCRTRLSIRSSTRRTTPNSRHINRRRSFFVERRDNRPHRTRLASRA